MPNDGIKLKLNKSNVFSDVTPGDLENLATSTLLTASSAKSGVN